MITHNAAARHYLEDRHSHQNSAVADMMRHFEQRYQNSKAFVLTGDPADTHKQLEKQWTRQTSALQQQRSASTNANTILELTVAITRMQRATAVIGLPAQQPSASLWVSNTLPDELPATCRTLYLIAIPSTVRRQLKTFVSKTAAQTLVVDYSGALAPKIANWPLAPKQDLDANVLTHWQALEQYLVTQAISLSSLLGDTAHHFEHFDNALDTLLDDSNSFLRYATQFEQALHAAAPFPYTNNRQRQLFTVAALLTKRVATLTPSMLDNYLTNLEDSQGFYLQDGARAERSHSLVYLIAKHYAAGRKRLAHALELHSFTTQMI